jgi:hypothetical protein
VGELLMGIGDRLDGEIEFCFEKANFFRTIHVDGAVGAISPGNKMLHISVYSERTPIPKTVVHKVENGLLGAEIMEKRQVRTGVFRELEADLIMNLTTAQALRDWLTEKLTEAATLDAAL